MNTKTASEERRRWLVLAVTVAAQFMVIVDVAVVNVALPAIKVPGGGVRPLVRVRRLS